MMAGEEQKLLDKIKMIHQRFPRVDKLNSRRLRKDGIVFNKLRSNSGHSQIASDLDAYQLARDTEKKIVDQYSTAAEKERNPQTKELLLWLAALELQELQEIERLYDFVNAPTDFLAWGEFSNLDEYHNFGRYEDLRQGDLEL